MHVSLWQRIRVPVSETGHDNRRILSYIIGMAIIMTTMTFPVMADDARQTVENSDHKKFAFINFEAFRHDFTWEDLDTHHVLPKHAGGDSVNVGAIQIICSKVIIEPIDSRIHLPDTAFPEEDSFIIIAREPMDNGINTISKDIFELETSISGGRRDFLRITRVDDTENHFTVTLSLALVLFAGAMTVIFTKKKHYFR